MAMVGKTSQEAKGQDAKSEASCFGGQRCSWGRTAPSSWLLAAFFFSVVSIASCVYLGMKTNDLQARVLAIETAQGDLSAAAASYQLLPSYSLDQLNSWMQEKVERLLAQVCGGLGNRGVDEGIPGKGGSEIAHKGCLFTEGTGSKPLATS
ncbi:UNVERIFIED_CONTAM: hypothetical protein K2H54_034923 [Gekko kuhli]